MTLLLTPGHFTLQMEAERTSETLVSYNTKRCQNPEDFDLEDDR